MVTLLITYDLNKPGQNYDEILKFIKSHGAWAKLSESSYAIKSNETAENVFEKLTPFLDKSSRLFVVTLNQPVAGMGGDDIIGWLKKALPK